jgi:nucleoside-diphosphate-sugar epimerase
MSTGQPLSDGAPADGQELELHVVLGAGGQAGRHLVHQLHAAGLPVRAVTRSGRVPVPVGVTAAAADATDPAALLEAVRGAGVVHHVVGADYRHWAHVLPAVMSAAIQACRTVGARLVYLDNLYALGAPEHPMAEADPPRPVDAKGQLRADIAATLQKATQRGDLTSVVLRASDFYAPDAGRTLVAALVLAPLAAGRQPSWPADLDQPHSLHYLPDVARALTILATDDRATNRIWHLTADRPVTGRQLVALAANAAGRDDDITTRVLSRTVLRLASPFNRGARDVASLLHQYDRPYVIDGTPMTRTFGFHPTTHEHALDPPRDTSMGAHTEDRQGRQAG